MDLKITHSSRDIEKQATYWMNQLTGKLPVLQIFCDHPRPPVQSFFRRRESLQLEERIYAELNVFCARENISPFVVLLGTFRALLQRYTDQDDVIIGTVSTDSIRHRLLKQPERFTNLVALRVKSLRNPPVHRLLQIVDQVVSDAAENRDYPFEELVAQLARGQDASRAPVFQAVMVLLGLNSGISAEPVSHQDLANVAEYLVRCDLVTVVYEEKNGLRLECEYDADLFVPVTIQRLLGHFHALLEEIITNPDQMLYHLQFLSDQEKHQLLVEWNDTRTDYPKERCLHHLFEEQCEWTPDAIAVIDRDEAVTYRELNSRANQLSHYLREAGVKTETLVGISMERSIDMVVGLLGILKAGGAYVPLDPAFPQERLALMLADTRMPVLLASRKSAPSLSSAVPRVICMNVDREKIAGRSVNNPVTNVAGDNVAYVLYTSGSTGKPKGVQIEHRAVTNLLIAMQHQPGLTDNDVFLAVTTLSFDIASLEIFLPLIVGARLVIASGEEVSSGAELLGHLARDGITVMQATPATWRLLLEAGWRNRYDLMILCGGESLPRVLANQLLERVNCVWNMYGPTETTIWSLTCCLSPGEEPIPIGRPVANTRIYLLDHYMQLVPIGVPGEIYIGGAGVARGYLNRPDLTAERFIPDSFGIEPGARLYRTGDLARYLPDGTLEFLGRLDHQVKIRGFRVELEEIENILEQHFAVKQAIVLAREVTSADKRLVAYVVPKHGYAGSFTQLRAFLQTKLPGYMIPSTFVFLDSLPLGPNQKVDRQALPAPEGKRPELDMAYVPPATLLEETIAKIWQDVLGISTVGSHDNFFDLGGHSLLLAQVYARLRQMYHTNLSMVDMFKYPTIHALARQLMQETGAPSISMSVATNPRLPLDDKSSLQVAIIGMAGRFPGARNLTEFWSNLQNGLESITFFSDQELLAAGVDPILLSNKDYVKAGAVLEDYDQFDAAFFGMSPREAAMTDPQHRLFLEVAWEALENTGYDPGRYVGEIGVFAGSSMNTYLLANLASNPEIIDITESFPLMIGNDKDFLATRVSYKLDLKGPSVVVQTACSTSLVAVHLACRSLLANDCDMALAGGVSVRVPQRIGYQYQEGNIRSPDGHCRAFDVNAQGTVFGSGVGIVVLKRLADAMRDGDCIRAIIKGSAINNDGIGKVGYTAPSVEGQARVIQRAQNMARISPETITYVEAHGTGTPLGDPVEIAALTQTFRAVTQEKSFCAIGSVKTNIGHLDAAAGVAGLIKTVLALEHRMLPPSLNFEEPNPGIDFENSPFYVNTAAADWPSYGFPRRAGVSSLGIGGTNAHVVLEEAPATRFSGSSRPYQLLMISARTDTALDIAAKNLVEYLQAHSDIDLSDVAYTLHVGRRTFRHRLMMVCRDLDDAIAALEAHPKSLVISTYQQDAIDRPVAFMFPGQGTQYPNMASELYKVEPEFREHIEICAELLRPRLGLDLRSILFPENEPPAVVQLLDQTALAQPALFVVEYALAQLWMRWGVRPWAMIGHSIGEYVAACLSGVLDLEDALALVATRGQLMQTLSPGAMLAVHLPECQARSIMSDQPSLSVAAINGPSLCVISGPIEAVESLQARLSHEGIVSRRLHVSHAFHSAMIDPILEAFTKYVSELPLKSPKIPYLSNVTGTWIKATEATDPNYWSHHLRQTVRFGDGLQKLLEEPGQVMLEVGPGRTLGSLVRLSVGRPEYAVVVASLRHAQEKVSDAAFLLSAAGQLWLDGVQIDGAAFYAHERRNRVALPTYPFERGRYWIEPREQTHIRSEQVLSPVVETERVDLDTFVHSRPALNNLYVAPRNKAEEQLVILWQESLGIGQIGVEDNFFELGGDSLIALSLVHRIREKFGQELSLATFFEGATISRLASILNPQMED